MSLLAPLFLFGLLGIALPIWLHRLQTQTTEREQFSSAMFLEPSKQRIHVKRKLKYLLLMALRILFLILLVLAFARPSFLLPPQPLISDDATHHVIVIDSSLSMNEGNNFAQGLTLAQDIINAMPAEDQSSIYSASSSVISIAAPTSNKAELTQALEGLSPDTGRLDIGNMISSLNGLIEASQANFVLHVISDFQQSGQATRFADMIPDVINGRPMTLELEQVKTNATPNWAVDSVQIVDRNSVRVGIKNYSAETSDQEKTLSLSINDIQQQQITQNFSISSEGISFVEFENVSFEAGDNKIDVQLSPGDQLSQDDLRYTVFDNSPPAPVLFLSADLESLAVTYITAALETAPRGYEVQVSDINDIDTRILQRYPWLVIDDLGAVNASLADALIEYLNGGGSVLAALGERSQSLAAVPVTGQTIVRSTSFSRQTSHSITGIDTSHPALNNTLGWNNVNVAQAVTLEPSAEDRILITLDDNTPLLLERGIGLGSFMLFSTGFDNTNSDLPVKPVFVSFMAEAAQYLSKENVLVKEQVVDSYLQLSQTGGTSGQVFGPDGESLLSLTGTTQAQDILLNQRGYYQVFTPAGEIFIAVNADSRESDLGIMSIQARQNWQNAVAGSSGLNTDLNTDGTDTLTNTQVGEPEEMELWRALLMLLAVIVLAESLLSNRYLNFRTGTS